MDDRKMMREQRARENARKQARKKKGGLIALVVILAVVLVLAILVAVIVGFFYGKLNKMNRPEETYYYTQEEYDAFMSESQETVGDEYEGTILGEGEDVDWGEQQGDTVIENSEDVINILVIGQDRRANQGRSRSDVLILCTVNKVQKTITLTSFMRDMYVQIPGYESNRINAPYVFGGMELIDKTLETNFGVKVDGNVEVDFNGFIDIVDMMGGVDIELTAAEAKYMNVNHSFDVAGESGVWNLKAGMQHLTGSQALSYARMRYVGNSDYERTERQRRVLTQLIEKAKGLSITELNLILDTALPMITTDLSNSQILGYAFEMFPILSQLEIKSGRIPVDGGYQSTYVRGMAVLVPDLERNREVLAEIMDID